MTMKMFYGLEVTEQGAGVISGKVPMNPGVSGEQMFAVIVNQPMPAPGVRIFFGEKFTAKNKAAA